jgi:hypothetical protein
VPNADSTVINKVTYSDKLDNKQNNKLTKPDSDLNEIVTVWLELPEHIKAAIKALTETHIQKG